MKKYSLAAFIAVMLSAGITLQTQAQTKPVNLENFTTGISVKTTVASNETKVYNKAGKLVYTVKRYDESLLPKEISRLVRNQFYDFDIVGVEEVVIASDNSSVYFVHIANDNKLKTVKVLNGEPEVLNEYKKG